LQELEEQVRAARQAQEAAEGALAELRERRAAQPEDADVAEIPARPRRGRKPGVKILAAAETVAATIVPRKGPGRPRKQEAAPAREPKPIRWWLTARGKKKR
jgi:hypothetical protein